MNSTQKSVASAGVIGLLALGASVLAVTNVDPIDKYSWGENIGFMNWADANGGAQGVEVFADHLEGWIWLENCGWCNTGNGSAPYANTDDTNFGVNILPGGNLDGLMWCENIGWVNCSTAGIYAPGEEARFDFGGGRFRGYAWGENVGHINLDDGTHFVAATPTVPCCLGNADKVSPGVVNFNDITIVLSNWLNAYGAGNTGPGDADCDGVVNFNDITTVLSNWLDPCP